MAALPDPAPHHVTSYRYMREYAVRETLTESAIQSIIGGTTEIMKEIIGRSLGL